MPKTPLALFVAPLGAGMTLPVVAQQQNVQPQTGKQQQGTTAGTGQTGGLSIGVGHNTVDAVDDVRESVADIAGQRLADGVLG